MTPEAKEIEMSIKHMHKKKSLSTHILTVFKLLMFQCLNDFRNMDNIHWVHSNAEVCFLLCLTGFTFTQLFIPLSSFWLPDCKQDHCHCHIK